MGRVLNGIFVTTAGFSKDALEAARKSGNLRLVDGDELARLTPRGSCWIVGGLKV